MLIQSVIKKLITQQSLTAVETTQIMHSIMHGELTAAQIAAFLIALHIKGETVTEIAAATKVIRELAIPVHVSDSHLVDIVGTGGDQSGTFNISTTSAFVVAAAGAKVAKHHNRAVSSRSGSADVLEIAGIHPPLAAKNLEACLNKLGIAFIFAPLHHIAWKNVAEVRRELGVRTIFNLLGPLANPAAVPNLLVGVYTKKLLKIFAEVFRELNAQHVLVVHSADGLDEISIAAPTYVAELKNNEINTYTIQPEQFGISLSSIDSLKVNNAKESFALMQSVLNNQPGPARDIVALNAGAAIYAANLVDNIEAGVIKALEIIASGAAKKKFEELRKFVQDMSSSRANARDPAKRRIP